MLTRFPISHPIDNSNYNNNNLHQYDPYILINDTILIDNDWFLSLSEHIKKLIHDRLNGNYELGKVEIPHPIQKDNDSKMLKTVYDSYIDGFDYNIWYNANIPNIPQNVNMIYIPNSVKKILTSMFKYNIQSDDEEFLSFKNEINKYIIPNTPYFVRLSGTSGKNENSLEELYSVDEIINHLTSNKLFVFQEYEREKDTYLIIMPWNYLINPRCEFRLFVVNGKLTGASIQKWYELIQHSSEELEGFEKALSNITFLNEINYSSFIADVYVDLDTDTCHLIEINPFGAHCGAGSSLFNWVTDYDMLHGIDYCPQLRYQSIINY